MKRREPLPRPDQLAEPREVVWLKARSVGVSTAIAQLGAELKAKGFSVDTVGPGDGYHHKGSAHDMEPAPLPVPLSDGRLFVPSDRVGNGTIIDQDGNRQRVPSSGWYNAAGDHVQPMGNDATAITDHEGRTSFLQHLPPKPLTPEERARLFDSKASLRAAAAYINKRYGTLTPWVGSGGVYGRYAIPPHFLGSELNAGTASAPNAPRSGGGEVVRSMDEFSELFGPITSRRVWAVWSRCRWPFPTWAVRTRPFDWSRDA